jgi:DHA1 family multidrug resistance protein-like MFS transporter
MNLPAARRRRFHILWTGQFLTIAGLTVLVPLLPFYLRELGATPGENSFWTGMTLAAPAITQALTAPFWGRLGDRMGRKWMVVRALSGLAVALLAMGLAQTPLALFISRLFQGACGGVVEAASAFAASEAPEEERGGVLGRLHTATAAGSLLGPLVGGLLADGLGFRPLLWIMGALTAGCAVLCGMLLQENRPVQTAHRVVQRPPIWRAGSELWQNGRLRAFLLAGLFAQTGIYGLVTAFAPHVERLLGDGGGAATWVGILQALAWGAGLFGAVWWGKRNDSQPMELNLFWALALCGFSIVLQAVPPSVEWLMPLRLLQGFAYAALLQTVMLAAAQESGEEERGERMGAASALLAAGQIAGPLLGGMAGSLWTTGTVFVAMGGLFLAGALCVYPRFGREQANDISSYSR